MYCPSSLSCCEEVYGTTSFRLRRAAAAWKHFLVFCPVGPPRPCDRVGRVRRLKYASIVMPLPTYWKVMSVLAITMENMPCPLKKVWCGMVWFSVI